MSENLSRHYKTTLQRYTKLSDRYQRRQANGSLSTLSKGKRDRLATRLQRLLRQLDSMQVRLGLISAGGALALSLAAQPAQGQFLKSARGNKIKAKSHFQQNQPLSNSFEHRNDKRPIQFRIDLESETYPALVDIDDDGDLDLFVGHWLNPFPGSYYGRVAFFENAGDSLSPNFADKSGTANPLSSINIDTWYGIAPSFVDIDGDGDFDVFIGYSTYGGYDGEIAFYENTGTKAAPSFVKKDRSGQPP